MDITPFLEFAKARHQIYHNRLRGLPRSEWTNDPIFREFSFTNVFRELDKTTVWYRKNVRERYDGSFDVFMATILFRWFNRIETGEALFNQFDAFVGNDVATSYLKGTAGRNDLKRAILAARGKGPYTTGAYIITSPAGMNKLDGVLECVDLINRKKNLWEKYFTAAPKQRTLEETWETLCAELHMGPFMAYEAVTDLRHTYLLRDSPDIYTWANPGPGAKRGLLRLARGSDAVSRRAERIPYSRSQCIQMMHDILRQINQSPYYDAEFWGKDEWEMRDVEHTLCEHDKYERVRLGQGRPRALFKPSR